MELWKCGTVELRAWKCEFLNFVQSALHAAHCLAMPSANIVKKHCATHNLSAVAAKALLAMGMIKACVSFNIFWLKIKQKANNEQIRKS